MRYNRIRFCASLPLIAAGLLFTAVAHAAGIEIRNAHSVAWAGSINVSADMDFELSGEALEALENGVALHMIIELQARQERRWLWDRILASTKLRFRIERQALSDHYLVTRLPDGEQNTFLSLQMALDHIGRLRDYPLMDIDQLQGDRHYTGRLRARLDIESLPAPLQPLAYVSSGWRLASAWYEWPIQT